jgi:hypothetical protein
MCKTNTSHLVCTAEVVALGGSEQQIISLFFLLKATARRVRTVPDADWICGGVDCSGFDEVEG